MAGYPLIDIFKDSTNQDVTFLFFNTTYSTRRRQLPAVERDGGEEPKKPKVENKAEELHRGSFKVNLIRSYFPCIVSCPAPTMTMWQERGFAQT